MGHLSVVARIMAYSSVRVQFEIGHEASVRTKKTPEGFTHDWEVFVRGADNTDIQCFVEKVVFHLHETFPKPRRVIKEPPYVVKESGYAGFVLPIDVYLKNKEEPKKINFQYDLHLQNSGPPISRVLREPRVFQNPSEDFRRKLIRGGGVGVDTPSEVTMEESKHNSTSSLNKAKIPESSAKKHKPELPLSNSFAHLFGTPIRRITPEPKKIVEQTKKIPEVDSSKDKKKLSKHSPHKEEKERDKYSDKERSKEREKNKEKSSKRPPSPPPVPVQKPKEEHKKYEDKEKKKDDYDEKKKRKEEREKKDKHKDFKEIEKPPEKDHKKDKKEYKDGDYLKKVSGNKVHDTLLPSDKHTVDNSGEKEKDRTEKEKHKHRHKKKEKEKIRDKEKHKKDKEKSDKDYRDREREKDKIFKKKHEEFKEREEKMKRKSRSPSPVVEKVKKGPLNALLDELGSSDSASPLSEEEDSIPSFKSLPKTNAKNVPEVKIQPAMNSNIKLKSTNINASAENKLDKEIMRNARNDEISLGKNKKDKSPGKKNKKSDKDLDKRRMKEEHKGRSSSCDREKENDDIERLKKEKEERERSERLERERLERERLERERLERERLERERIERERLERERLEREREQAEKDRLEKERLEAEKPKVAKKEKESTRKRKRDKVEDPPSKIKKEAPLENNVSASQSATNNDSAEISEEIRKPEKFTKEYVAQLRDLQHRIMTLEDSAELQKVVQVIAETGQYEITKKTFDFDLCALDSATVRRLQEFFSTT